MNEYYIKIDGNLCHRAPIKLLVNPVLRWLQFWLDDPYVIASITEFKNNEPDFIKFKVMRVRYR